LLTAEAAPPLVRFASSASHLGSSVTAIPADPALELRHVTKIFPGASRPAVDDLNLEIPSGELVVLVGPSGCGKTTTLRMLNRLEEPTSGEILLNGVDIREKPTHELRRGIGYVIQQVGLFPHRTIGANIATVPRLLGWEKERIAARVDELAALVDLDRDLLDRYPSELSGGQQQRVGVARALAVDPPVLLMDEPYSAVDPIVRARLQDELVALHDRLGTTIVFVTHDIDEAIKLGDRIAMFASGGHLAQYATPAELLANPASAFVAEFLGGERTLRRLALLTLADLRLDGLDATLGERAVTIDVARTAREALDLLLSSGAAGVVVTRDGQPIGRVTLAALSHAVDDESV
jgi:osmoprotectant transport system ATP-binding protein